VRPDDECPYEKPFPAGFASCSAFAPRTYIALDLQYRPLAPVWTCSHLTMRRGATAGGFYGCCSLGSATERVAYAASLESERVALMRRIRAESVAISTPLLQELWALKGSEMIATKRGDHEAAAATARQLRRLGERFNAALDAHFEAYADEVGQLGMDAAVLVLISKSYVDYMIATGTTVNSWSVPDELLARFPEDVRRLLRPDGTPAQRGAEKRPTREP
jgi:hypothetical protein